MPLHAELEEYLLGHPSSDSLELAIFPELHGKLGGGKSGLSMGFRAIMVRR